MNIPHKPTATAGQIVRDLELTVEKWPNLRLGYCCDDFNERYVKGVKQQEGLAVLETTSNRHRAATATELLSALRPLDASTGVALQDGCKLLDIEPVNSIFKRIDAPKEELKSQHTETKKDDTVFWFSENTDYRLLLTGKEICVM